MRYALTILGCLVQFAASALAQVPEECRANYGEARRLVRRCRCAVNCSAQTAVAIGCGHELDDDRRLQSHIRRSQHSGTPTEAQFREQLTIGHITAVVDMCHPGP